METNCEYFSYESTGYFSGMMIDYVNKDEKLKSFYNYPVSTEGIKASIEARKQSKTARVLLIEELKKQYENIVFTDKQKQNLQLLSQENTFTVCTAHQPNIFTGPLYFIYKILHAVKLADDLNNSIPEHNFVPFYYMGSEDADIDELGHIFFNGDKLVWDTKQTGAVGRMKVDKQLIKLIDRMAGELEINAYGSDLINLMKAAYKEGVQIQQATLQIVNELFKNFGLLVLIPDNAVLKKEFNPVVKKELLEEFSHSIVEKTSGRLRQHYKVQASGREINLFYLTETKRARIEKDGERFKVEDVKLSWTQEEILAEVEEHPERFSANVILRGVFQETILPNIAFIGGGGEIAYWLELQKVFEAVNVPFPVLIVRNSFVLINEMQKMATKKLGFTTRDLFKSDKQLINTLISRETDLQLSLDDEKKQLRSLYNHLEELTGKIDITLTEHTAALYAKAIKKIDELEKKMLRSEKRKFESQNRQINKLKQQLFPGNNLQERTENFSPFYAKFGKEFLDEIYKASLSLEQQFGVLEFY